MTIIQLEYFLAVVNHGSFSAAAERCFVTQPSLSTQIAHLEDELGVTLLDRTQKPIVPTEAGRLVAERAKETLSAFYATKETISEMKGEVSGKLRLGVIPTISPYLMPGFIPEFVRRCPNVELEIRDMVTADIIDALNRDEIDIAILSGGQSDVKIRETELFDDKLYLYVSPRSGLMAKSVILIEDIDMKQLLILSEGNCLRNQVLRLCKAKEKVKSPYGFVTGSIETLMRTVDATAAVTVIPGMTVGFIPEEKRKQVKPFGRAGGRRRITMAVGRTCVKEALIEAVRESVVAAAKDYALADFLVP